MWYSRKILLLIMLVASFPSWAAELTVHVRPNGNDRLAGVSEDEAVATLQRALKLAAAASDLDTSLIRISLQPGIYKAQSATTRGNPAGIPILITSAVGGRAVFDGDGHGGVWLKILPRGGNSSNLKIIGLEVTNYETAIDVAGNRYNSQMWAGGVEIRANHFHKIGDIAREGAEPSTAAIRLVNSDQNIITKNNFVNIKNNKLCALLHSLYIAHGSTGNLIEDNLFENACGDAIRFRDRSDNNVVRKNRFSDAWSQSPVSDWFCNPKQRTNCRKSILECPSSNIIIEGNSIITKNQSSPPVFMPYGGMVPAYCGIPPGTRRAILQ